MSTLSELLRQRLAFDRHACAEEWVKRAPLINEPASQAEYVHGQEAAKAKRYMIDAALVECVKALEYLSINAKGRRDLLEYASAALTRLREAVGEE